jgi:hypothetical protein
VNVDISFKKPNQGINPFSKKSYANSSILPHQGKAKRNNNDHENRGSTLEEVAKDDGLDYYFAKSNMKTDEKTLDELQHNRSSGLRRTKTVKSQSALKAHMHIKNEIDDANNEAYELYKSERQGLKATLSNKEHEEFVGRIRNPMNKYTAVQSGISSTSAKTAKRRKRSKASQLNQTLLS